MVIYHISAALARLSGDLPEESKGLCCLESGPPTRSPAQELSKTRMEAKGVRDGEPIVAGSPGGGSSWPSLLPSVAVLGIGGIVRHHWCAGHR